MGKRKTDRAPADAKPLDVDLSKGGDKSGTIVSIALESPMTTSIGVVMTEHIVAGRLTGTLGQQKLEGERLRYPSDTAETEALIGLPTGELYDLLVSQIAPLIAASSEPGAGAPRAVPAARR